MPEKRATALVIFSLTLLLLAIFLQQRVRGLDRKYSLYNDTGFLSSVTAGCKKFVARECWLEADVYLHQGLMHEYGDDHDGGHEGLEDTEDAIADDHHHHHGDVEHSLLVPYNRKDFSQIKHETEFDDKEILPWLRLTAFMDPHLTKAYAIGGHWLAWRIGNPQEALKFLEEGLHNNPGAPDILSEIGIIYFDATDKFGTRDIARAIKTFDSAMETERDILRRIELLTYLTNGHEQLGQYEKALVGLDQKLRIMSEYGMQSEKRYATALKFRREIVDMLESDSSN